MTYWRLHYHIIWSTMDRQSMLTPNLEKMFYGVIHGKARELGLKIHAAGNVEDHVHLVVSIPPRIAVADCVRHLKGASAYAINHRNDGNGQFEWQAGYGALTVSESALKRVMEYAARQKEHHRERAILDVYEKIGEEE
jgi:putative transposase